MSILVVGASHRSAPVELLEQLAVDTAGVTKLLRTAFDTPHVSEALVLATCNRVEVYAEVDRFHGSVEDLTALLADRVQAPADQLIASLYVHYDAGAVAHLFSVACGLQSMVVGEGQVLGQVRQALRTAQAEETVGPSLNSLFQQGLRVGKRAHSETGIDRAGRSLVSVALDEVDTRRGGLSGARLCVLGAGSIATLTVASARDRGVGDIVVLSRTLARAQRLAAAVGGRAADMGDLSTQVAQADVVISCTGARDVVLSNQVLAQALSERPTARPLTVVDLALPHDVDSEVDQLPGVALITLPDLAASAHNAEVVDEVAAVEQIVTAEVTAFAAARDAAGVTPTVVALRTMATAVVAAELERLWGRLGDLTPAQRAEITRTMRRTADKLLHEPTVRVRALAGRSPESSYADALAELFALDPAAVEAVTRARAQDVS